jgi:hypothetical protein
MAMNYCFDIPVKLLSTMLVVMSLYLLSDNFSVIAGFLFQKRLTALKQPPAASTMSEPLSATMTPCPHC